MRPQVLDVARTLRLVSRDLAGFMLQLATFDPEKIPSTANARGLAEIAERFAHVLRRARVELDVIGRERVPREGGLVFMWNQESHLDHLVLPVAIPRPFFSLYNNELSRFPLYGRHMRRSGHVHVDRNDERQWRASVRRAAERVRAGETVLVSPEGTRSRDGELLPMKRGAFILAIQSGRPIVCVTVIGGHARLPRGSPVVRGGPMRVVLGDPISVSGHREDDLEPLKARVAGTFQETKARYPLDAPAPKM